MSNAYFWIAIVCGVTTLVLIIILTILFVLYYFNIIPRSVFHENTGINVECNGLPLGVELPFLTEEQLRRRERAMAKYRRDLEKEERRKARSLRQKEQARGDGVEEAMSVSSSTSTQETLITRPPPSEKSLENSTVVYGRAEYARHRSLTLDSENFCSTGFTYVHHTPISCGSSEVLRPNSSHHGKSWRRRRRLSRQSEASFLNPWDIDVLNNKNTDSDTTSSVVSSLPRPPEVVLGNTASTVTNLLPTTGDQLGLYVNLMAPVQGGYHSDWLKRDKQKEHSSNTLYKTSPKLDPISPGGPTLTKGPCGDRGRESSPEVSASELISTKVVTDASIGPLLPPRPVSPEPTSTIQTKHSSKKLSVKDAQYNITLSGFFTMPPGSATAIGPTESITTLEPPKLEEELRCSLAPAAHPNFLQDQSVNYTSDAFISHSPFASPLCIQGEHVGALEHVDPSKTHGPSSISISASPELI